MASAAPAKIILKSSTKISLNDRFTNIMKTNPVTTDAVRAQVATERLASEKNRRLAQQMERRPAVAAELEEKPVSLRDRLGGRRGRGGVRRGLTRGFPNHARGSTFSRLGRGQNRSLRRNASPRFRGNFTRGRRATRGRSFSRGRGTGMRGRGSGRGTPNRSVNKDTLDEQLDSYMSKTKGTMDDELDSYMAEINK